MFKSFNNNTVISNHEEQNGVENQKEEEVQEEEKEIPFDELINRLENSAHREYIRKARGRMLEMMELMEMSDWKELSSKDGVTVYTKMMEKNIKAVRGIGEMPFPAELVSLQFHSRLTNTCMMRMNI